MKCNDYATGAGGSQTGQVSVFRQFIATGALEGTTKMFQNHFGETFLYHTAAITGPGGCPSFCGNCPFKWKKGAFAPLRPLVGSNQRTHRGVE
jgi:hypothetical protein